MIDYYGNYIAFLWNNMIGTAKTVSIAPYPLKLNALLSPDY
jgi:hypothetical protein